MWTRLSGRFRNPLFWCGALIFALSVSLYVQTLPFDFVEYDDQIYVYKNPHVLKGLCLPSLQWAFGNTGVESANWHPLTFISLMTDVSLFGANPGAMHLHNAVLHGVDGVLLFAFLLLLLRALARTPACLPQQTGVPHAAVEGGRSCGTAFPMDVWIALLAALFWALHPLRVESVAWVSSRKDVLCLFWYLIGMLVYLSDLARDSDRRGSDDWRICVTAICFFFAFMSKPTAVVFPATAILLEYALTRRITWRRNEVLFYAAVAFMMVTICVQDAGGALDRSGLRFSLRLPNAIAAIGQYLSTTIWPCHLSCFYPYEVPIPWRRLIPGCMFVLALSYFVFQRLGPLMAAYPAVPWQRNFVRQVEWHGSGEQAILGYAAGILWFVVALLPVMGILQVGIAACADRYTYLSGVGLSIVLAVFLKSACAWRRSIRAVVFAVAACAVAALYPVAYRQVGVWRNQLTLFSHAERAVKGNHVAYGNVGTWYFNEGRYAEALEQFIECAKALLTPTVADNLASTLSKLAGDDYTNDVFLHPIAEDDPLAAMKYHALGLVACCRKMDDLAETFLKKSLAKNPREYQVWEQLGFICERQERMREAEAMFEKASALNPSERGLRAKLRQIRKRNEEEGRR